MLFEISSHPNSNHQVKSKCIYIVSGRCRTIKCLSNHIPRPESYDRLSCLPVKVRICIPPRTPFTQTWWVISAFHYAIADWVRMEGVIVISCALYFSHQWTRRHLTALHSTLHVYRLSSCCWLDSGLSVRGHVFWRRRVFREWFAGRVGSNAFKASLLLLASQKSPTLLLTHTNLQGSHTHFFDSKLPWQFCFLVILQTDYISNYAPAQTVFLC